MQDTHNEHAFVLRHVEHDVRSVLVTPQMRRQLSGTTTKHWLLRKVSEAFVQAMQVALRLRQSEIQDRVLINNTSDRIQAAMWVIVP